MSYSTDRQHRFISYAESFAQRHKTHIYLGGSFKKGTATEYSDIDLYFISDNKNILKDFIYGYSSAPVYISNTINPQGILIVIYKNGVSLDLSAGNISPACTKGKYFHCEGIDHSAFTLNSSMYRDFILCSGEGYSAARLFHRSLIKYLSGKQEAGVNLLKEIAEYLSMDCYHNTYRDMYSTVYGEFTKQHTIPDGLNNELIKLYNKL